MAFRNRMRMSTTTHFLTYLVVLLATLNSLFFSSCGKMPAAETVWPGDVSCHDSAWIPERIMGHLQDDDVLFDVIKYPMSYGVSDICSDEDKCWNLTLNNIKDAEKHIRDHAREKGLHGACLFPRRYAGIVQGRCKIIWVSLLRYPETNWMTKNIGSTREELWFYYSEEYGLEAVRHTGDMDIRCGKHSAPDPPG
jgi:hypothetical protein